MNKTKFQYTYKKSTTTIFIYMILNFLTKDTYKFSLDIYIF